MSPKSPRKTVGSVHTNFRILEALKELEGAGVTELAKYTDMTKGTVYNHLATLEDERYVVKDESNVYHLGLRFLDLAYQAKERVDIYPIVTEEVDILARESGELALFTVEEHNNGVCLYTARGENAVQTDLYVGQCQELHHTAVGKAILAHMPEEQREEAIRQSNLEQMTENTITDPKTLREELVEVRERGIAYNREEAIPGLVGVGGPIKTQNDGVGGAISIIGPAKRLDESTLENELSELIMQSVNVIEVNSTSL